MPTYEYACNACGHEFEKFQSITARPIRTCPECGLRKVRRLIGAGAGILFKGSGFYQTDYRSESYRKAAEKDKPAAAKKDGSGEKSSADKASTSSSEKSGSTADKGNKSD